MARNGWLPHFLPHDVAGPGACRWGVVRCWVMQAGDGTGQRGHVAPKHVWVDGDRLASERTPGILLDWRTTSAGGWEAYVVWADGGGNVKPRAYFEWLPAERVTARE